MEESDFMKKKKKKLSMSLGVLIVGFLISTSSLNTNSSEALVEEVFVESIGGSF